MKVNTSVHAIQVPKASLEALSGRFPEGVNILLCAPEDLASEFVRLPKAGEKCPVTQLPRSTLIGVLKEAGAKVKTHRVRRKGATTGVVLIERASLVSYIDSLPAPEWAEEDEDANKKEETNV